MLDDGVSWPWVQRVSQTALLYATADADAAQAYWLSGGQGKALMQNQSRATARSRKKAGPSGTKASRKGAKKAAKPRGSGSSSGGR
ncbi:hypothetical protein G7075_20065 [Phycicoccus sp. HDW14]|nr:hypothetical protein [Phycicoccus sp. HDW14]QIM22890.1 hypothetical protein G7075_20065 [Phycicoccus sp. HDW14]